jgi:hypothetical protein
MRQYKIDPRAEQGHLRGNERDDSDRRQKVQPLKDQQARIVQASRGNYYLAMATVIAMQQFLS